MYPGDSGRKNYWNFIPWSIFMEAMLICIVGAVLGLGVNYPLVLEMVKGGGISKPAQKDEKYTPDRPFAMPVEKQDVIELIEAGAIPVDARARDFFAEGHLPGARSLPADEIDSALGPFLKNVPLQSKIIVYCSGYGCPDSEDVAIRLMKAGFSNVMVYEGGFPEWQDAGLPVKTGGQP
jgi:rhodanese-related sulfurtransferase